jgi:hypothetical protein
MRLEREADHEHLSIFGIDMFYTATPLMPLLRVHGRLYFKHNSDIKLWQITEFGPHASTACGNK